MKSELTTTKFRLIFIRHAQTDANVNKHLIGGRSPMAKLSELGFEQAKDLGKGLTDKKIDMVFCSPLIRCVQTAKTCLKAMNREELIDKIILDDNLIEFSQGNWEGVERKEVYTLENKEIINGQKTWFNPPKGESLRRLKIRASLFLHNQIMDSYFNNLVEDGSVMVVFGHGLWIKMALMEILGLDQIVAVNLELDNCGLSELEFGAGGWKLLRYNWKNKLES
jgi:probable phosphoglycerate mutase